MKGRRYGASGHRLREAVKTQRGHGMILTNVTIALVLTTALVAVPAAMATSPNAASAQQAQHTSSKLKGTMKALDATTATVVPANNKNGEIIFQIDLATAKAGALENGASVEVTYHFSEGKRIATALTGK